MASNIAPLLLGAGAVFLLMRGKDANAAGTGSGYGSAAGGDTPCHLLEGIWAAKQPDNNSHLAGITDNAKLRGLALTAEAFQKADAFMLSYIGANPGVDKDAVVFSAQTELTAGIDCPWASPTQWTPRMHQVHDSLNILYDEGVSQYS